MITKRTATIEIDIRDGIKDISNIATCLSLLKKLNQRYKYTYSVYQVEEVEKNNASNK